MTTNAESWAKRFERTEQERCRRVGVSLEQAAAMVRRDFPAVVTKTLARADEALRGLLILPSTGGRPEFVGNPPRWHENKADDPEYGWLLNRMSHWIPLLRAWRLTGDDRFADKVVTELDDWIVTVPMPEGQGLDLESVNERFNRPTPWRALETGIRMYHSWSLVPRFLAGTPWLEGERADRFAASLVRHAQVLSVYAPLLWPNADHNHLMMEMLGLLHAALMLRDHPRAEAWREQAVESLVRCCQNQFTEGGGQIEGCPHYHIVCLDVIASAVAALREHGLAVPPPLMSYMREGMGYMLQTTRPTGDIVPWGDSDPHPSTAGAVEAMWALNDPEPIRLLRSLTSSAHVREVIGGATWKLGDIDTALAEAEKAPSLPPTAAWHKGLHQVSARTSWDRDAASVFFACRSPVNNGHAHIDPAGFDYTALGKPLLVDPGRLTYRRDESRKWFKSAAAHNTLTVDGRDPFEYINSWAYGGQRRGVVVSVTEAGGQVTMVCEQENFWPAIHRRTAVLRRDGVLVVVDRIDGLAAGSTVQRWFHFNSTTVRWDAAAGAAQTADEVNVLLCSTGGVTGTVLPGRISTAVDVEYPSHRLRLESTATSTPFAAAALIIPYHGATTPQVADLALEADVLRFTQNGRPVIVPV